jgi:hypothetical protein
MSSKTIKVNPIFLMGAGGSSPAKNKTRKEKPVSISLGQPNNIKKKLIARIKNFQQEKNVKNAVVNDDATFINDFSESVDFLNNLARDKQEHKVNKRNATLKKKQPPNPEAYMQIATELPPELLGGITLPAPQATLPSVQQFIPPAQQFIPPVQQFIPPAQPLSAVATELQKAGGEEMPSWVPPPQPLYSNLKTGGTKPTYRTWLRNTQKNKHVTPVNKPLSILEDVSLSAASASAPVSSMFAPSAAPVPQALAPVPQALAQTAAVLSISTEPMPTITMEPPSLNTFPSKGGTPISLNTFPSKGGIPPGARPHRKKVTRTLKYKLGKHANGKVSVLIKNNQTRRRVQTEQAQLKQKSIIDIKNYLRSKNLLKVGSEAPNDVLRHIYEQSILAGQIENKAKETLIHNYFNEEKK